MEHGKCHLRRNEKKNYPLFYYSIINYLKYSGCAGTRGENPEPMEKGSQKDGIAKGQQMDSMHTDTKRMKGKRITKQIFSEKTLFEDDQISLQRHNPFETISPVDAEKLIFYNLYSFRLNIERHINLTRNDEESFFPRIAKG